MTPLDHLAAGRVSWDAQWTARMAICRHVRGPGTGPRFRRGSNSWRDNFVECLFNPDLAMTPCPNCGAPGEELTARGTAHEWCPACQTEIALGDYDFTTLADCLGYRADLAAGLVESEDEIRCSGCRRPLRPAYAEWHANGGRIDCARAPCPLRASSTDDAPAPTVLQPPRPRRPVRLAIVKAAAAEDGLAATLARLGQALDQAAERVGATEDETPHDARRRNFDAACAAARERDRAREGQR